MLRNSRDPILLLEKDQCQEENNNVEARWRTHSRLTPLKLGRRVFSLISGRFFFSFKPYLNLKVTCKTLEGRCYTPHSQHGYFSCALLESRRAKLHGNRPSSQLIHVNQDNLSQRTKNHYRMDSSMSRRV